MNCNDVNSAWGIWKNKFNDACDEHAPVKDKLVKGYLPEWIDSEFIKLSFKDRDYCYSKAHKTNDPMDWEKARSFRNKVNNLNKYLKKKYYSNAIKDNVDNCTKLWQAIKKLIPDNKSTVSTIQTDDGLTTCHKDIANESNSYFTSVGTKLATKFDNVNTNENQGSDVTKGVDVKFEF